MKHYRNTQLNSTIEQIKNPAKYNAKKFFILYTVLYIFAAILVYNYYFRAGRSFIWFPDGQRQHYQALMYYGRWMRSLVHNIFVNHSFSIPTYTFGLGYGGDIVNTLHYYCIGDPLNLLAVFVPAKYTYLLYDGLVYVRLYLSGLAFAYMCYTFKKNPRISAVAAGALVYVFSAYTIFTATRHPYFINPMFCLPLIIAGVERLLKENKPGVFVAAVCVSAVANLYFFYMLVIFTVMYVVVRLLFLYGFKNWKSLFGSLLKLIIYAALGSLIGAVILLPAAMQFLFDPRMGTPVEYDLFYTPSYYKNLFIGFISYVDIGSWLFLGFGSVGFIGVFTLLITRKKRAMLKVLFAITGLMLLFPYIGHLMNGMSYPANRFSWAFALVIGYIVTDTYEDVLTLHPVKLTICGLLFGALCTADYLVLQPYEFSDNTKRHIAFTIVLLAVIILLTFYDQSEKSNRIKSVALVITILLSIGTDAYYLNSYEQLDYTKAFVKKDGLYNTVTDKEGKIAAILPDQDEFYRYTGPAVEYNGALLCGKSSTAYYFSLSNANIYEYFDDMNLDYRMPQVYTDLDDFSGLNALASVRYYFEKGKVKEEEDGSVTVTHAAKRILPLGYDEDNYESYIYTDTGKPQKVTDDSALPDNTTQEYRVYRSSNYLPLGYTYDTVMSEEEFNKLTPEEKHEAVLQCAVVENAEQGVKKAEPTYENQKVDRTITCDSDDITYQGNSFIVTKKNASVTLTFDDMEDAETYLKLVNFHFKGASLYSLYTDDESVDPNNLYTPEDFENLPEEDRQSLIANDESFRTPMFANIRMKIVDDQEAKTAKTFQYSSPTDLHYMDDHDFLINMGYHKNKLVSVTLSFDQIGTYTFDSIDVICQPMDRFDEQINKLKEDVLTNVDLHQIEGSDATNHITGEIDVDEAKILTLTVPWSNGFSIFVDGEKQELLRVNKMFMGVKLEPGRHTIELKYRNSYFVIGIFVTLIFTAVFIILLIVRRKNVKKLAKRKARREGSSAV